MPEIEANRLILGDNLQVLRDQFPDESVDLIYLDPPFMSNLHFSHLQRKVPNRDLVIADFSDKWQWSGKETEALADLVSITDSNLQGMFDGLKAFLGESPMMAYLVMISLRLIELKRILKRSGKIYLHCDPHANHYLRLLLDAVFGAKQFLNEIIWHYRKWTNGRHAFQRNHDVILLYARGAGTKGTFNQIYMQRAESTVKRFGDAAIKSGVDVNGKRLPARTKSVPSPGVRQDDVWTFKRVAPVKQLYPTQKPLQLLERIVLSSSNEGDLVLDPFCGSGTTLVACERLGRRWIGIDSAPKAIGIAGQRVTD